MPSSWDVYYVVFLSALLALCVPAFLALVSYLVSAEARRGARSTPPTPAPHNRTALGRRINARFFLGVNASLILITLALALIPCAGMLQREIGQPAYLRGLIAIITLAGFSGLGLLYSASKGDLGWVNAFQALRNPPESDGKVEDELGSATPVRKAER